MKNYMKKAYEKELREHLERSIENTKDDLEYFENSLRRQMEHLQNIVEVKNGLCQYGVRYNSQEIHHTHLPAILKSLKYLKELERELNYYKALLKGLDGENNE